MDHAIHCRVLGNVPPQGLCGSGLVDAVAAGLGLGQIQSSGRFTGGASAWKLAGARRVDAERHPRAATCQGRHRRRHSHASGPVRRFRRRPKKTLLAGAFGNYINRASAQRIGLINFPPEKVEAAGNTALLGAKLALFRPEGRGWFV